MDEDIAYRILSCDVCKQKTRRLAKAGKLQQLPVQKEARTSVNIDFISGLPLVVLRKTNLSQASPNGTRWEPAEEASDNSVNCILVITDRYSKGVRLRAVHKSTNSRHVLQWLAEELYRCFGWPKDIIQDNDIRFGEPYKAYLKAQGINLHFTSVYHPQTNGLVERMNSTVMNVLRTICNGIPHSWPYGLAHAEFAINSTPASTTGKAPFSLFLQFPPRTPLERTVQIPSDPGNRNPILPSHPIHQMVQARMREEQVRQKARYDQNKREVHFKAGDQVYLRRSSLGAPRVLGGETAIQGVQMRSPFLGPFRVVKRKWDGLSYELDVSPYTFGKIWHVSHLVTVL